MNQSTSGFDLNSSSFGSLNTSHSDRSMKSSRPSCSRPLHDLAHLAEQQAETLRRNADAEREVRAAAGADAVDDLEDEPAAVLERAAVTVVAPVVRAAQELAQDVAVRAVQFDAVEAGALGADRRGDEVLAQLFDLGQRQRPRARLGVVRRADRLRADQVLRRAHAGVVQLHVRDAAGGLDARGQPRQPRQVRVRPAAELARESPGPAPARARRRSSSAPKPPCARSVSQWYSSSDKRPVDVALQVGERREHEAVLQARAAGEGERIEQGGHGGGWPGDG